MNLWPFHARRAASPPRVVPAANLWPFHARRAASSPRVVPYDLFDAVVAVLRSSAAASVATGGFHAGYAGAGRTAPYVELYLITGGYEYLTDGTFIVDGQLQANAYAATRLASAMLADLVSDTLKAAAKAQSIVFQRGRLMSLRAMTESFAKDPDPGVAGDTVYQQVRLLRFLFSNLI